MKLSLFEPLLAELSNFPDLSDFADLGLFGLFGFTVFRWLSTRSDRTSSESWEMLNELVDDLQESNKKLTETTASLTIQLQDKDRQIALLNAKLNQMRGRDLSVATKTLAETNSELVIQLKELAQYDGNR